MYVCVKYANEMNGDAIHLIQHLENLLAKDKADIRKR